MQLLTDKPIWFDLDGVVADYNKGYELIGGKLEDKGKIKAATLKPHPNFYRHLEFMPDGLQLWNYFAPYKPSILSAQSNFCPASRADKKEWVGEVLHLHDPSRIVIVDYPKDKWKYCTPGAILIDDSAKNCEEWNAAGGKAILHVSAAQTVKAFHFLVDKNE